MGKLPCKRSYMGACRQHFRSPVVRWFSFSEIQNPLATYLFVFLLFSFRNFAFHNPITATAFCIGSGSLFRLAFGQIHHRIAPFLCNAELSTTTVSKSAVFRYWGRTVTKLQQFDLPVVNRFQPTVLILEIGSNDLCIPNCNANDLATTIFHLIQQLHFDYHVDHVIVSQIMPRCSPPAVTPPYNTRVWQVNDNLYYLLKQAPFASFWYYFALLCLGNKVFLPDSVHLSQMGKHLLYHSYYQKALFRYFSRRWRSRLKSKRLLRYRPSCSHRRRYK